MKKIKLGYEIGTGEEVLIDPAHLIVTGVTQQAGKTTALESMIKDSHKRAIVFKTKIGEKSFLQGTIIPPFFVDRSDWQFVQGLVESTIKEKLNSFDRSRIISICKETGGHSLIDFKKRVVCWTGWSTNNFLQRSPFGQLSMDNDQYTLHFFRILLYYFTLFWCQVIQQYH